MSLFDDIEKQLEIEAELKITHQLDHYLKPKNLLLIGDSALDQYIFGTHIRDTPENPNAPLINLDIPLDIPLDKHYYKDNHSNKLTLGCAGNVLTQLYKLNNTMAFMSLTGDDNHGIILRTLIEKNCHALFFCQSNKRPTTTKTRIIAKRPDQQNDQNYKIYARLDYEDTTPLPDYLYTTQLHLLKTKFIDRPLPNHMNSIDAIICSDYNKGFVTPHLVKELNRLFPTIPWYVQPKNTDYLQYINNLQLLAINKTESLLPQFKPQKNDFYNLHINERIALQRDYFNTKNMVITLSQDGVIGCTNINGQNQIYVHKALTEKEDVVDVSGAGDTFFSVLSMALLNNTFLSTALELASIASSVVIKEPMTTTVSLAELENKAIEFLAKFI